MRSRKRLTPPKRYYHKGSTGAPLVLIHGIGGTWRIWEPVVPLLEASLPVLAPTLAGHWGGAGPPGGKWPTVNSMADDVETLMNGLGIGKAHVVGHSMGGAVALELLRRRRALSVLALCPGVAWPGLGQRVSLFLRLTLGYGKARTIAPRAELLLRNRWVRRFVFRTFLAEPEALSPAVAAMLSRGMAYCPAYFRTMMAVGASSGIRPLRVHPGTVRLIWAANDRVVPVSQFREALLERVGALPETVVEGVGHLLMFDDPRRTARLVLDNVLAAAPEDRIGDRRDRRPPEDQR
ncbi:pimeloyl-ACP methyl ester carboxylesterase [Saccharothrix tamanrassetensis]|uniref:Pimeloyl-ACP methyl ester carboxylesterase n=1 Tax=Saccharothrix tamanrassetensis TaxID=1051531 RepID=A0A841CF36_9PSEU|nr:alpha/beta fold hydrolase [Saccharothrix tamanrassetensis]MBB5957162.1 pimeloyl-ACP methyl ester carboxylesterase [Saccharothrix tamanrassetensis]